MALVGRARVRLDLQNFAGAIADEQRVTVGYVKNVTRDDTDVRRYDAFCEYITCATNRHATVAPNYRNVTWQGVDRKSTRLNSSHANISYAVFCLKKKKKNDIRRVL